MRTVMFVLALVLVAACKKDEARPAAEKAAPAVVSSPGVSITNNAEFEKVGISLIEQLVAIFNATATDCDVRTTQLNAFLDARDAEIKALNIYAELHPEADTALDSKIDSIMESVQGTYAATPGAKTCDDHKGFLAAMERYP